MLIPPDMDKRVFLRHIHQGLIQRMIVALRNRLYARLHLRRGDVKLSNPLRPGSDYVADSDLLQAPYFAKFACSCARRVGRPSAIEELDPLNLIGSGLNLSVSLLPVHLNRLSDAEASAEDADIGDFLAGVHPFDLEHDSG